MPGSVRAGTAIVVQPSDTSVPKPGGMGAVSTEHDDLDRIDPNNADTWPELLTTQETAKVLRIHIDTIRRLIKAGELPAKKLGRDWMVSKRWILHHYSDTDT